MILKIALVEHAYRMAVSSMRHLNRNAARLMLKYGAHGATDVTGFGILGHSRNLVEFQKNSVSFEIHTMPVINKMASVNEAAGNMFKLLQGVSSETSGGLLLMLPRRQAPHFIEELYEMDGKLFKSWIVGDVVNSPTRLSSISKNVKVVDVSFEAP